jgi:hypothetical protein
MKSIVSICVAIVTMMMMCAPANAATVTVGAFGDQGWKSDDTRSTSTTDLVGTNYTHAGKPGQTPTAADDAAIAERIQFVSDAPGGVDALKLSWTNASGKATLSTINTGSGFATGDWQSGFFADLRMYRETNTNTTLKIGIQSTQWAQSQLGFTAIRSGESVWDLDLVYTGAGITTGSWQTASITATSGTWNLFDQSGNGYYSPPGSTANKTLAGWAADALWGPLLFGAGAKVTDIQIGAGSFSVASTGYVDYLQTSLLNGGEQVNFVPEPMTLGLLGLGGLMLRRRMA